MFLKQNYGILSVKEIAKRIGKSEYYIYTMARKLKLSNIYCNWSDEENKIFEQYYPLEGTNVVNRLPNKTVEQCRDKAHNLKLNYIGNKTSKFKYVNWNKQRNKWVVMLWINGKTKYFGSYVDEDEAGRVALEKAKEFGKAI